MTSRVIKVIRRGRMNARCRLENGLVLLVSYAEYPELQAGTLVTVPENIPEKKMFSSPLIRVAVDSDYM